MSRFVLGWIKLRENRNQTVITINEKELSLRPNSLMLNSRDDKIRTCDHTPPRRVLYRAELHPELRLQK